MIDNACKANIVYSSLIIAIPSSSCMKFVIVSPSRETCENNAASKTHLTIMWLSFD